MAKERKDGWKDKGKSEKAEKKGGGEKKLREVRRERKEKNRK